MSGVETVEDSSETESTLATSWKQHVTPSVGLSTFQSFPTDVRITRDVQLSLPRMEYRQKAAKSQSKLSPRRLCSQAIVISSDEGDASTAVQASEGETDELDAFSQRNNVRRRSSSTKRKLCGSSADERKCDAGGGGGGGSSAYERRCDRKADRKSAGIKSVRGSSTDENTERRSGRKRTFSEILCTDGSKSVSFTKRVHGAGSAKSGPRIVRTESVSVAMENAGCTSVVAGKAGKVCGAGEAERTVVEMKRRRRRPRRKPEEEGGTSVGYAGSTSVVAGAGSMYGGTGRTGMEMRGTGITIVEEARTTTTADVYAVTGPGNATAETVHVERRNRGHPRDESTNIEFVNPPCCRRCEQLEVAHPTNPTHRVRRSEQASILRLQVPLESESRGCGGGRNEGKKAAMVYDEDFPILDYVRREPLLAS